METGPTKLEPFVDGNLLRCTYGRLNMRSILEVSYI